MTTASWITAAAALIKMLSVVIAWMERQSAEKAGFNKAIALEMEAATRARAKIAGIEAKVKKFTDEQLAAAILATRRPPKGVRPPDATA